MAKTLAQAQANWERKTQNAGEAWKSGTAGAGGAWARGMSEFLGSSVSARRTSAYESGVGSVSAGDFQSRISGKGEKYARRLRESMSR